MYLWFHNLLPWASSEQNQRTGCPTLFIARTPNRRTSGFPTPFIARIPMNPGRRKQVVQHCSYREPRTEEHLVQQVGTRSNVQGATANSIRLSRWRIPADIFDDRFDEVVIFCSQCWPSMPLIFEDSQVLLVQRCVKKDQRHSVASNKFPEIRAKSCSFYLVLLLRTFVWPFVYRCPTHPCPILFLPLAK